MAQPALPLSSPVHWFSIYLSHVQGYLTVKLEAHAPAGHSSSPPKVSAITTLARAIVALEANPVAAHMTPADELFGSLAPGVPPPPPSPH
jgi:hypothetical protein